MPQLPRISHTRSAAVQILSDVTDNAAYANVVLRQYLSSTDMDARDRAFITELVNTTLRNLIRIDFILDAFSNTPVPKMTPYIRSLLRIAVCQLRFMDKVPARAAVDEAVRLAKLKGFHELSGFVNGLLRNIVRMPDKPKLPKRADARVTAPKTAAAAISLLYSYPEWLAMSLVKWLGADRAGAFAEAGHNPPAVSVIANTLKTDPASLAARLEAEGVTVEPGGCFPEALRLKGSSNITQLSSFREGLFFVIDEGALAAVRWLDPRPGMRVLDLCAAPGGKSFACAMRMNNAGEIIAFDIHQQKLRLIRETAYRLGIRCISPKQGDAAKVNADLIESADAVLLDAPCSGLGVIRKHPDIKLHRKPADIKALAEIQMSMLDTAAAYVKPGGTLLYCTCTVSPEENMENVRRFTAKYPFTPAPPPENYAGFIEDNCLQLLPGRYNDGFFMAKLIKQGKLKENMAKLIKQSKLKENN